MQLHTLQKNTSNKKKKRIGRGGKRGTYSGSGIKGQKARAGHRIRPEIRDIIKKIPKHRGYRFSSIKVKPAIVTISELDNNFSDGDIVNPTVLMEKKIIKKLGNKTPKIKILSDGEISKKLKISDCSASKESIIKIEKAGGTFKLVSDK